jgi:hypothetical protein
VEPHVLTHTAKSEPKTLPSAGSSQTNLVHLAWLLAGSMILMVLWSLAVPAFEAPDEYAHWQYANHLHHQFRLPYYNSTFIEANQPPLYYFLIAPFAADTGTPPLGLWIEPRGVFPLHPPKFYVNSPTDFRRYWPIRTSRIVTGGFSLLTVLFAYLAGLEATGNSMTALLAGSLTALLPQFTFRGMNISNDALVAATCSVCVYLIVRLIKRGFTWRLGWITGAMIGLAFLSKIVAIFLPASYALSVLSDRVPWRERVRRLIPLALSLAIAAPWLIRNEVLYGNPLAERQMALAVPGLMDQKPITSPYFLYVFPALMFRSFVGVFGYMNLYMPGFMYKLFFAGGLVAVLGFFWQLARRRFAFRLGAVLWTMPLSALALTVHLNLMQTQPQGRYLFTALAAMAVIAAVGLFGLPGWNKTCAQITIAGAALANVSVLLGVVLPAYWVGPLRPSGPDVLVSKALMTARSEPLKPGTVFAQSFVSHHQGLNKVETLVSTGSARIPSGTLRLHLRPGVNSANDIASWSIPLSRIVDNSYVALEFPPLPDSNGRSYTLALDAESVPEGHAVTVWLSDRDVYPEGEFFSSGHPRPQDTVIRTYYLPEE